MGLLWDISIGFAIEISLKTKVSGENVGTRVGGEQQRKGAAIDRVAIAACRPVLYHMAVAAVERADYDKPRI